MEKWILLSDFLSDKARYDKLTKLFIDYKPDYNLNKRYKEWLSDYLDINLE